MVKLLVGERKQGETDRAAQACNDYLRMGPGRSLPKLLQKYSKTRRNQPPTDSLQTLKDWSGSHDWQQRASLYDAAMDAEKTEQRRKELETGLAQDFERIRELKRLAMLLKQQIFLQEDGNHINIWLPDVKQIGSGEDAQRIDIVRFNTALIDQYRATLDDLAKEVGDRRQKHDVDQKVTGTVQQQVTHAIDSDTAGTIFDILTATGALATGAGDTEDDSIHPPPADS